MSKQAETNKNPAGIIILGTLLFSIAYVVVRYHIFGGVPWKDFPFFILNKIISLTAFVLLTYNFSFGSLKNIGIKIPENWIKSRNVLGMTGFLLVVIHVLMSFLLFTPKVYSKFFEPDGTLTLLAGLSMLGGVLAFVVLWTYNFSFQTQLHENKHFIQFISSRKFMLWALVLGATHLFFMGYKGWINPLGWHGGIPPVSLLAFAIFIIGYLINLIGRK